jgi:threonine dehydrogenase-like Zn-dependent dehydrogenase
MRATVMITRSCICGSDLWPNVDGGQGEVVDRTIGIDGIPDGYRAMADREALKVLIRP